MFSFLVAKEAAKKKSVKSGKTYREIDFIKDFVHNSEVFLLTKKVINDVYLTSAMFLSKFL